MKNAICIIFLVAVLELFCVLHISFLRFVKDTALFLSHDITPRYRGGHCFKCFNAYHFKCIGTVFRYWCSPLAIRLLYIHVPVAQHFYLAFTVPVLKMGNHCLKISWHANKTSLVPTARILLG